MPIPLPVLDSLGAAGAFGDADAADAANLTRDIYACVMSAICKQSGKQVKSALDGLKRSSPEGALAALAGARTLADDGRARITELEALHGKVKPLRDRLDENIAAFRVNLERPSLSGDVLQDGGIRALLERRISHFTGLVGGLERCSILVERLLSTERLEEDQMMTLRDAATPIAVQDASLFALSNISYDMEAIGNEIDAFCEGVISADTARLRKLNGPSVSRSARRLFGRQRFRL